MPSTKILKIIPSESLLVINPPIKCSVAECNSIFKTTSNLHLHLEKHHKINVRELIDPDTEVQYYCPATNCKYNATEDPQTEYFKSKKYLRQHYMKVHATKIAQCTKCGKSFASSALQQQHERSCGATFKCVDCDWSYSSRECLLTHCRRKGHSIPKLKRAKNKKSPKSFAKYGSIIAPKKEPQTSSIELPSKKIRTNFKRIVKKGKDQKISQETQTASLYNTNCTKISKTIDCPTTIRSKSIGTSTTPPALMASKYSNLDLIDDESSTMIDNHSQTCNRNLNSLNYMEDDSSLHYFTVGNFNSGLCHIETQTELIASRANGVRDMDPLLCHMHTQTSDEILTELGLSDIQTQTHWPDSSATYNHELFVSTETQTCYPQLIMDNISIHTQTVPPDKL